MVGPLIVSQMMAAATYDVSMVVSAGSNPTPHGSIAPFGSEAGSTPHLSNAPFGRKVNAPEVSPALLLTKIMPGPMISGLAFCMAVNGPLIVL